MKTVRYKRNKKSLWDLQLNVCGVIIVNLILYFDETKKMQRKMAETNIVYVFKYLIEPYAKFVT